MDTTEQLPFHFSLSCIGQGNGDPLQCSCLENPRDGGAWWAAVYGVAQSRTRLKRLSSSSSSREELGATCWCFPCLLPLYQLIILSPSHSRVNTKEGEELSGTCSEITGERATPVWRVGKNRIQIYPFCSYYFIVGCWSGTVPKESEVVEVTIFCRKKGNCGKNTVVKNEVCISYAPTDLEMLPSGVMRSEFCGLSLIHASPPGYILLEMMY